MLIDLSSWYKDSLAPKIEVIRKAIEQHRELEFFYYAPGVNLSVSLSLVILSFDGQAGMYGDGVKAEKIFVF